MSAVAAAIVVGGGLAYMGSREASKAAESAAQTQAQSIEKTSDEATALQREMFYKSREDLAPWLKAGERSLADLEKETAILKGLIQDPSSYTKSPGYNFLLKEGINAVNQGNQAAGLLDSGQNLKDLMTFGQGLASQDYGAALDRQNLLLNRLAGTAGVGQSTAGTIAGMGTNYANAAGNILLNKGIGVGNAYATGDINQANARTSLYQNLGNLATTGANNYFLYNLMKGNQAGVGPSAGSGFSNYPSTYGMGGLPVT